MVELDSKYQDIFCFLFLHSTALWHALEESYVFFSQKKQGVGGRTVIVKFIATITAEVFDEFIDLIEPGHRY